VKIAIIAFLVLGSIVSAFLYGQNRSDRIRSLSDFNGHNWLSSSPSEKVILVSGMMIMWYSNLQLQLSMFDITEEEFEALNIFPLNSNQAIGFIDGYYNNPQTRNVRLVDLMTALLVMRLQEARGVVNPELQTETDQSWNL